MAASTMDARPMNTWSDSLSGWYEKILVRSGRGLRRGLGEPAAWTVGGGGREEMGTGRGRDGDGMAYVPFHDPSRRLQHASLAQETVPPDRDGDDGRAGLPDARIVCGGGRRRRRLEGAHQVAADDDFGLDDGLAAEDDVLRADDLGAARDFVAGVLRCAIVRRGVGGAWEAKGGHDGNGWEGGNRGDLRSRCTPLWALCETFLRDLTSPILRWRAQWLDLNTRAVVVALFESQEAALSLFRAS